MTPSPAASSPGAAVGALAFGPGAASPDAAWQALEMGRPPASDRSGRDQESLRTTKVPSGAWRAAPASSTSRQWRRRPTEDTRRLPGCTPQQQRWLSADVRRRPPARPLQVRSCRESGRRGLILQRTAWHRAFSAGSPSGHWSIPSRTGDKNWDNLITLAIFRFCPPASSYQHISMYSTCRAHMLCCTLHLCGWDF